MKVPRPGGGGGEDSQNADELRTTRPLLSSPKALLSYSALAMVVVANGVSLFSPSASFSRNSTRTPLDLEHRIQKHHRFATLNTTSRTLLGL